MWIVRIIEFIGAVLAAFYLLLNLYRLLRRWRAGRQLLLIVLLSIVPAMLEIAPQWSTPALAGNSTWCQNNPSICVCDEPLQATSYATLFGYDFNPNDTSTFECTKATPSAPGSVLEDGAGFRYVVETSGEMFTALPSGATATHLLRTKTGAEGNSGGGGKNAGHDYSVTAGTSTVRREWQGYKYWSSGADVVEDGLPDNGSNCSNTGKIMQLGMDATLSAILTDVSGGPAMYGWIGWNMGALACCVTGPGFDSAPIPYTNAAMRGKWYRLSVVVTNTATTGSTTVIQVYMKNITDGTAEVKVIDTSIPHSVHQPGYPANADWTSTIASTFKPSAANLDQIYFDMFRRDVCAGFIGIAYITAAAWSTDSGQRIGPMVEMEGGGSSAAIGNLVLTRIVKCFPLLIGLLDSFMLAMHFWYRRAAIIAHSLYIVEIANPSRIWWAWRYRRAVEQWQRSAPVMIDYKPVTLISAIRSDVGIEKIARP